MNTLGNRSIISTCGLQTKYCFLACVFYLHLQRKLIVVLEVRCIHPSQPGFVLAMGEGDTGQLGLGPDIMDRSKPARVKLPADVIQICSGGMHSVCLTVTGEVSCSYFHIILVSIHVFISYRLDKGKVHLYTATGCICHLSSTVHHRQGYHSA